MNTRRYPQSINLARHTHDGGHGITQSGSGYDAINLFVQHSHLNRSKSMF